MRAAEAVVEVLRSEGVDRVFGNPGTTELPFLDALVAGGMEYVLGLHEGTIVSTADAYARTTGRTAFVNLHVAAGVANGLIGMLNARRSRTPLVVTAGQQDRRHLLQEPMLGGDLVALAAGACKSAVEVSRVEDLVPTLRRAFALAEAAPAGPVFVSLPMDLFDDPAEITLEPRMPRAHGSSSPEVPEAAARLLGAQSPAIVAGDAVGRSKAVPELIAVAEALGAVVYHQPMYDGIDFPLTHPLHAGMLPPTNENSRKVLGSHDVILLAGARFWPHHYTPGDPLPAEASVIQVDDEIDQLGRPAPAALPLLGDVKASLAALAEALGTPGHEAAARAAAVEGVTVAERLAVAEAGAAAAETQRPMTPEAAAHVIASALPASALVVEEAITLGLPLRRSLRIDRPGHYLHTIGGGLGWGIGAAVGAKLGRPDLPVVAVVGDGCATFGVHGLWTAANQEVPVLVIVANNGEYRTLKQTTLVHDGAAGQTKTFLGMDLASPRLDWGSIAAGFGVDVRRVTDPAELSEIVEDVESLSAPLLVDLAVAPLRLED